MGRSLIKRIIILSLFLSLLVYSLVSCVSYVVFDKRVRIYYNITLRDPHVKYYEVVHANDTTKLVVVFDDGTVVSKYLPLDVGYREPLYPAIIGVIIILIVMVVFGSWILVEMVQQEIIRRRLDP